jgi:hypothetical protein
MKTYQYRCQSSQMSFSDTYLIIGIFFLATTPMLLFAAKGKQKKCRSYALIRTIFISRPQKVERHFYTERTMQRFAQFFQKRNGKNDPPAIRYIS